MKRRRTAEEIARMMREADRDLAKGLTVTDVCRKLGIGDTTFYRWRERTAPAENNFERRCRQLEGENERLKQLLADVMLDKQMLQVLIKKKW